MLATSRPGDMSVFGCKGMRPLRDATSTEEVPESIVQYLDVGEHAHRRMVLLAVHGRPCSTWRALVLGTGLSEVSAEFRQAPPHASGIDPLLPVAIPKTRHSGCEERTSAEAPGQADLRAAGGTRERKWPVQNKHSR